MNAEQKKGGLGEYNQILHRGKNGGKKSHEDPQVGYDSKDSGLGGQYAPSLPALFPFFSTGISIPPTTRPAPLLSVLSMYRCKRASKAE